MIEVYSWPTPNGHKVHIMLEECGLPYRVIPVNIGTGEQFKPEFLAISPNNKIPALIDTGDGVSLPPGVASKQRYHKNRMSARKLVDKVKREKIDDLEELLSPTLFKVKVKV
jgi:hypothetical protein